MSDRALTVAHVVQWFEVGGGEFMALHLAGKQAAAGHRVMALALRPGEAPMADKFEELGVSVYTIKRSRPGLDPTLYARLLAFFLRHRPDVVHTHDPHSMVYAAAPARAAGAAVVHTKHGVVVGAETRRQGLLMRGVALFIDAVVAISDDAAAVARDNREIAAHKVRVIENGVDVSRFVAASEERAAVRAELGIPEEAWVAGTVGRLDALKDHAMMIRAMEPLLGDDTHLVIVGDGAKMSELRAQVEGLANGRAVHLLGMRHDVPRLLGSLDLFALSSISEGLPLALLEAMACGLPVVATTVGGVPDVVQEGETGLLSAASDHRAFGENLARLRRDEELCRSMGARARELVTDRYSMDHTAAQYMTLYRELVG